MTAFGLTLLDQPAQRLIQEADKWDLTPGQVLNLALDAFDELHAIPRRMTAWDIVEAMRKDALAAREQL